MCMTDFCGSSDYCNKCINNPNGDKRKMTEKEKQFNQWFDEYADGVKVFEEADMKQAYLQGRADLVKENAELKERNAKLKGMYAHSAREAGTYKQFLEKKEKENAELKSLKDVADLIRLNNSHIVAMAQLNNNNVVLRKENAELKEELKDANKKVVHLACNQNKDLKRKINKAKEIIKNLMVFAEMDDREYEKEYKEAEQFLKEE